MTTIHESQLSAPRLELRWEDKAGLRDGYTVECTYSLVLRLGDYDIRRERCDDDGRELPDVSTMSVRMGGTLSTGTAAKRYDTEHDKIDTPFRDHSHALWDSEQLGDLPVYVVSCGRAMLVEKKVKP